MCGIVGYIGPRDAAEVLVEGLSRLEYRGYDSAGVAILSDGVVVIRRTVGKLAALRASLEERAIEGHIGVGHTRWATHGRPSEPNAHPQQDCSGRISVVHNGIVENYRALRSELITRGHRFQSETDTEVIAHLIEEGYEGDLTQAVRSAVAQIQGSYAIAAIVRDEPDRLVCVRHQSPLIVGLGDRENFIASDIPATLPYTRKVYLLDDGDMALVTADEVRLWDKTGASIRKAPFIVNWDASMATKSGHKHFMLKEIAEQPAAMRETMRGRLSEGSDRVTLAEMDLNREALDRIQRISIIACGTAYHAGLVGKYVIESLARIPCDVEAASEFRYRTPIVGPDTLGIVISQSGETLDTLVGLREARDRGATTLAITNVVGSSIAREAGHTLYTYAGPEIAVASTKAYTTQLMALFMLALHLAQERGTVSPERSKQVADALWDLPKLAEAAVDRQQEVAECARVFFSRQDFLFLGRGINFPTALEGALKLKEISYIHAEGYAAGEMKHGPIALVEPEVPTVAVALPGLVYDKMLSNMQEVRAREGQVIAVAVDGDSEIDLYADYVLRVPPVEEIVSPALAVIPLQLFAYHIANRKGCDVDQPRNLAKSVTVE
ncbi:MAG TPA: glutamine--fructose-6-phosphate transaminase (isomerizing) [Armatimonadota bacterium]|nr:glutamine--fructose-6-phosphate transaminase (isomerizing) [Armatimonadota bacterium]